MSSDPAMTRAAALAACAALFIALQLLTNMYHAFAYGIAWSLVGALSGAVIVSAIGTLGYFCGLLNLGRDFRFRTIVFIVVLGYFVSYSVTYLLTSVVASPWVYALCVFVVTMLVTIKVAPRWEPS